MSEIVVELEKLTIALPPGADRANAVSDVDLVLRAGKVTCLIGESGSGKSLVARSILGLLPRPHVRVGSGRILFEGQDLAVAPQDRMRAIRGAKIGMIFQEPMTALNPVFTVGEQVAEGVRLHERLGRRPAWDRAVEALAEAGVPDARKRASEYPHQLSGGLRQRAMIAMALVCRPKLLLADEPTTALDVSLQAQIIDLLIKLRDSHKLAILLITHDLGVVAEMADRVAVMYAGQIVEQAGVKELFARPRHPYTQALLASVPKPNDAAAPANGRLTALKGTVPEPTRLPPGCRFEPRCPHALYQCKAPQELLQLDAGRAVRCCRAEEIT
jgi:oligopeptide/dipeptide ABC transporter ATP-binding protein